MPVDAMQGLRGNETVLVVEDTDLLRQVLHRLLDLLGYTVLTATDAPSALALLERHPPIDLLLTDVRLPGMSGPQLAEAVRRAQPRCAVLLMTGHGGADLPEDPPARVLEKPFSHAVLARGVREALDARAWCGVPKSFST